MLRKKIKKLLSQMDKFKFKLLLLLSTYFLVTGVVLKLPYLNLYTYDFGWRLFIFYILFLIIIRPTYNFLIGASIFFLLLGRVGDVMGILIYVSLFVALIKYLIARSRLENV